MFTSCVSGWPSPKVYDEIDDGSDGAADHGFP